MCADGCLHVYYINMWSLCTSMKTMTNNEKMNKILLKQKTTYFHRIEPNRMVGYFYFVITTETVRDDANK